LLLIALPVAIVGLVEIVTAPRFGRNWTMGLLCVLSVRATDLCRDAPQRARCAVSRPS
jgi:hypothetical protein